MEKDKMRGTAPMRIAKYGYMAASVLLCALGVLLIVIPGTMAKVLGMICGILLCVFGGVKLVGYFSKDLYRLAFQYDLIFGILMIVLGGVLLVHPLSLGTFIGVVLGIAILVDALFKILIAFDAKKFGIREWWLIFALSLAAAVCGVILIIGASYASQVLSVLLGISLLSEGVLSFSTVITSVTIIKNQHPDVIEVEYFEKD